MREDRTLSKAEKLVGIIGVLFTLASLLGAYWILPYRLSAAEATSAKLEARIEAVEKSTAVSHELLVRIDERLKSVQERLHIPDVDRK